MTKLYHYIYRLTCTHPLCKEGPKYYYGCRSTNIQPSNDRTYWSSSNLVKSFRKCLGPQWFQKKILNCYETREQALAKEVFLHNFFNVKDHPLFFNQANQTSTGFVTASHLSDLQKQKLRLKAIGRKHTNETKQKLSLIHKGKKRKPLSDQHRQNIRQAILAKQKSLHYEHSVESRAKMSQSRYGKTHLEKTKQKISHSLKKYHQKREKKDYSCPWCGKKGFAPGIFIWHFSNCRFQKDLK